MWYKCEGFLSMFLSKSVLNSVLLKLICLNAQEAPEKNSPKRFSDAIERASIQASPSPTLFSAGWLAVC